MPFTNVVMYKKLKVNNIHGTVSYKTIDSGYGFAVYL